MGIYDLTKGAVAVSCDDYLNGRFRARIPVVVTEIIAANATLLAAEKITAADVIQLWDIPAGTVLEVCLCTFKVVTPGTASNTANIGLAGSTEFFAAIALDAAAGTLTCVPKDGGYGTDNYGAVPFATTDTIDMTFVADEIIGSFVIYVPGYMTE